jgi:hypothetical protein
MQTLCEVRVAKEGTEDDDEPKYETRKYILLHFGLKFEIIGVDKDRQMPVNYSVCICQDCETGWLRTFAPEEVRIIGTNIKK